MNDVKNNILNIINIWNCYLDVRYWVQNLMNFHVGGAQMDPIVCYLCFHSSHRLPISCATLYDSTTLSADCAFRLSLLGQPAFPQDNKARRNQSSYFGPASLVGKAEKRDFSPGRECREFSLSPRYR